jgi:hypothetical protein
MPGRMCFHESGRYINHDSSNPGVHHEFNGNLKSFSPIFQKKEPQQISTPDFYRSKRQIIKAICFGLLPFSYSSKASLTADSPRPSPGRSHPNPVGFGMEKSFLDFELKLILFKFNFTFSYL